MAIGGVLVFFAVATVARYIVRPVAKLLGWPLSRARPLERPSGARELHAQPGAAPPRRPPRS